MNVVSREMGQTKKKAIYSEEFQAMLDKLDEEDRSSNYSTGDQTCMMRKNRLCIEKVKALEKHFEEENKLQPERKLMIAREVGLQPRQVSIWFQNRRARWKSKQLEKEYDKLRASYDSLKLDYGSLQQEKLNLLSQLKDLKARIEEKTLVPLNSGDISNVDRTSVNVPVPVSVSVSSASSSSHRTFDPFSFASSSVLDGFHDQPCKANNNNNYYQPITRIEEMGMFSNYEEQTCSIFSVEQPPTLQQWYHSDHFTNIRQ